MVIQQQEEPSIKPPKWKGLRSTCLGLVLVGMSMGVIAPSNATTPPKRTVSTLSNMPTATGEAVDHTQTSTNGETSVTPVPFTQGTITLLAPGTGIRKPLRFTPTVGDRVQLEATLAMEMEVKIGDRTHAVSSFQDLTMALKLEVMAINDAGEVEYHITYDSITSNRGDDSTQDLIGMVYTEVMPLKLVIVNDHQGQIISAIAETPTERSVFFQGIVDSLFQPLVIMIIPLPEEPVGIGARWSMEGTLVTNTNTSNLSHRATYELVSWEGDRATIKMTLDQTLDLSTVPTPEGTPTLTDSYGTGDSQAILTPAFPLPQSGTLEQHYGFSAVPQPTEQQPWHTQFKVQFDIQPVADSRPLP